MAGRGIFGRFNLELEGSTHLDTLFATARAKIKTGRATLKKMGPKGTPFIVRVDAAA